MSAFPGHAGGVLPLLRWHSVVLFAFPGHAGRVLPLLRWHSVARMEATG
jgi:hypothetical protein